MARFKIACLIVFSSVLIAVVIFAPAWFAAQKTGITIDRVWRTPVVHMPLGDLRFALYMEDTSVENGRKTAKIYSSIYPFTPSISLYQNEAGQVVFEYCQIEMWPLASPYDPNNCRDATPQEKAELTMVFFEGQRQLKSL